MRAEDITFVVLCFNESKRLEAALRSVVPGSPCFVLDAYSGDDSLDIARRCGAQVEQRAWTDFLDARRYALRRVQTPWVFMLDADEQLDDVLRSAVIDADERNAAYECLRRNSFCGAVLQGGIWANERVLRLARTASARIEGRGGGTLHEHLVVNGTVGFLLGALRHDSYPTLEDYRRKFIRYTDIEARDMGPVSGVSLLLRLPRLLIRMLWLCVGRSAWRDGWRGIFVAAASGLYPIIVVLKAWRRNAR